MISKKMRDIVDISGKVFGNERDEKFRIICIKEV